MKKKLIFNWMDEWYGQYNAVFMDDDGKFYLGDYRRGFLGKPDELSPQDNPVSIPEVLRWYVECVPYQTGQTGYFEEVLKAAADALDFREQIKPGLISDTEAA